MQKRALPLFVFLSIILINFISAASFSLGDVLDKIDENTMIILFVFIVSFAIIFFSLSKLFKTNKAIAAVVSLATSFLLTYWVNKSGLNIGNWFSDIGISEETLFILLPILGLALAIFLIIYLKKKSLLVFGGALLVLSFFVEEAALLIVIGAILLVFGFLALSKGKEDPLTKAAKSLGKLFKK